MTAIDIAVLRQRIERWRSADFAIEGTYESRYPAEIERELIQLKKLCDEAVEGAVQKCNVLIFGYSAPREYGINP